MPLLMVVVEETVAAVDAAPIGAVAMVDVLAAATTVETATTVEASPRSNVKCA